MSDSVVEYRMIPSLVGYRVGDDGSVWSCRSRGKRKGPSGLGGSSFGLTDKWRQLSGRIHCVSGHVEVKVTIDGKKKHKKVHQLVLESFVGPRGGLDVRHLNGIATDNRLVNLCYGTRKENVADSIRHGTFRPFGNPIKN